MHYYLSTFIPGTFELVKRELIRLHPNTEVLTGDESQMTYKSEAEPSSIKQLRLFNNSFILIKSLTKMGANPIKTLVNQVTQDRSLARQLVQITKGHPRAVRVMFYEDNAGINVPTIIRDTVENYILKERSLKINRRLADVEVWITTRSNHSGFVVIRLTYFPASEKSLEAGQIKPQLAHLMCTLSEPTVFDRVLDPFSGYGSIPLERTYFKYKEIIASDSNPEVATTLEEKVTQQNKKITVIQQDAGTLEKTEDSSIDKIITDPPWGLYDKQLDTPILYEQFINQALRVLKPQGIMIILSAQKELLEKLIGAQKDKLILVDKYDVLVSGKKAAIYKTQKI